MPTPEGVVAEMHRPAPPETWKTETPKERKLFAPRWYNSLVDMKEEYLLHDRRQKRALQSVRLRVQYHLCIDAILHR